ncbi:hypothetical protein Cni_G16542 [Canna indica]|uniref:Uncharacterized protein n=1 Tax=Canna indica TaxID=4628 RepID=A0AAQ3KIV7_9LILI|nr:hypothetical protein Cni_G16542 [Canna indica]
MSPEYAMDGIFSVKSDVFSFGVLILEIITSRRNRGLYHSSHHLNLIGHVWTLWKEDKVFEIVDKSIADSFSMAEILSCMKVGLLCVQELPRDRPTMSSVVRLLGSDSTLLPEPKQPGYTNSNGLSNDTDSSTSTQHLSANNVSMTVLEGR